MHTVAGIGAPSAGTAAASNGSAGMHAADAGSRGPVSHFEIAVADPVKQGEGVSAFVSYKVRLVSGLSSNCKAAATRLLNQLIHSNHGNHVQDARQQLMGSGWCLDVVSRRVGWAMLPESVPPFKWCSAVADQRSQCPAACSMQHVSTVICLAPAHALM